MREKDVSELPTVELVLRAAPLVVLATEVLTGIGRTLGTPASFSGGQVPIGVF